MLHQRQAKNQSASGPGPCNQCALLLAGNRIDPHAYQLGLGMSEITGHTTYKCLVCRTTLTVNANEPQLGWHQMLG